MDLKRVALIAAQECERQQTDIVGVSNLLRAYHMMYESRSMILNSWIVRNLAKTIEPSNGGEWRSTPVTFVNGGSPCPPSAVALSAERMLSFLPTELPEDRWDWHFDVDGWLKHFLWIHPFTDGNGRLAWLFRVWLLDQWDSPENLPDFNW